MILGLSSSFSLSLPHPPFPSFSLFHSPQRNNQIRKIHWDTEVNHGSGRILQQRSLPLVFPKDLNMVSFFSAEEQDYLKSCVKALFAIHHPLFLYIYVFRVTCLWLLKFQLMTTCKTPD